MLQQRLATCVVVTEDMGMEGMVDTVDMEDMDTMERDLLKHRQLQGAQLLAGIVKLIIDSFKKINCISKYFAVLDIGR